MISKIKWLVVTPGFFLPDNYPSSDISTCPKWS